MTKEELAKEKANDIIREIRDITENVLNLTEFGIIRSHIYDTFQKYETHVRKFAFLISDVQGLNDEDLSDLIDIAVDIHKNRREQEGYKVRLTLKEGDSVSFEHKGDRKRGVVEAKNPKKCKVNTCDGYMWTVSYHLLRKEKNV